MDINKILDFHRMVMMSAQQHPNEDETTCGPLCQHPACWESNRRRERGVPHIKTQASDDEDDESDLPTVTYYNMLEDYGDSPKDRFPARYGGRALHDRSSSMRNLSHPLRTPSIAMTTAPFATPVSVEKTLSPTRQPKIRLVEVQEVFDKADLNSRWDETFMTRKVLVWVPNPNRRSLKDSDQTPRQAEPSAKSLPLLTKDLTESMVPLEIKQQREETILFDEWPVLKKKQARTGSPLFRHGAYPKTPADGAKPDVDAEGIRELLGLPRDVLLEVLERARERKVKGLPKALTQLMEVQSPHPLDEDGGQDSPCHARKPTPTAAWDSDGRPTPRPTPVGCNTASSSSMTDFVSRDKIHSIIEEVLSTARDRGGQTARDTSPRHSTLDTRDVLHQQKLQLHHSAQRHMRGGHSMPQQPVFQLDDEDKFSSAESVQGRAVSEIDSTPLYLKSLSRYKKPLPGIGPHMTPRLETSLTEPSRRKIPSVSLGLPELPSGLRHTRPFTYNNRHRPDFTLVPVPTPPTSVRSDGSEPSGHGTTMNVNLPSVSDLREADYYDRDVLGTGRLTEEDSLSVSLSTGLSSISLALNDADNDTSFQEDGALHIVSPALSTHVPQAPAGTPATFQSPTKSLMFRDLTVSSSIQGIEGGRSMPPSRDVTMSPGHKIVLPRTAPPGTASADEELALDTIRETARENGAASSVRSSQGKNQATESTKPSPQHRGEGDNLQPPQQVVESSPDYWPQVTESTYDNLTGALGSHADPTLIGEQSMLAEHGSSVNRGRSDLSSRGSNRSSSLARRIMDEGGKGVESPAPPPPSPEPKELSERALNRSKRESKSRESTSMEPLMEQNESESSVSPTKGADRKTASDNKPGQGYSVEPIIKEEATPSPQPNMDQVATSDIFDPVSKVMVSHVAPRPSLSREKLQQTFMNVDIPAEDISSLHAEQGSSAPPDFTPSLTASPEKMSQGKMSPGKTSPVKGPAPKTPPGPASPVKRPPQKASPRKNGSGGKKRERKDSKGKKNGLSQSPTEGNTGD